MFKQGRIPLKLQSDGGRKFNNNSFHKYMKEKGVHYFTTKNETKCSVVERFNRTLKEKNVEIFHSQKYPFVFKKYLPKLVNSYNSSVHFIHKDETKKMLTLTINI